MSKVADLPTELWLLVVSYLPKSELFQIKSLNSFFLDCYMDITWKYVMIDTHFPFRSLRLLQRVVDPFVATRVKTFATHLMFNWESLSEIVSRVMSLLLHSIPLLLNVTYLILEVSREPSSFFATLLRAITYSPLPRRLQKLRIYGNVRVFNPLQDYSTNSTPFESLTELDLSLSYRDHMGIFEKDSKTPLTQPHVSLSFVPFLRSLAPTLQRLCISNWLGTLDVFNLFNTLNQSGSSVPVPNLQSLFLSVSAVAISIPQSSLRSLYRFLVTHAKNLRHLHLTHILPPPHPLVNELLGAWLAELVVNKIQFPSLQTLQLHPPSSKIGMSALLTLIKRTAGTLSSLTIPCRFLTGEEINQLLDALTEGEVQVQTTTTTKERSSNLKVLDMNVTQLSVSLLDLLAHRLPQLENLTLCVSEIVDSEPNSFYQLLDQRRYDGRDINSSPTQDILHTWKLRYISIRKYGELQDARRAVAGAVPSVIL